MNTSSLGFFKCTKLRCENRIFYKVFPLVRWRKFFMKIARYCFCVLIMYYDDNFLFSKNVYQIMRYKLGQSWSRLDPICQLLPKKEFVGKFKCKIYVPIASHYATQDFTNILTVGHEV